MLNAFGAARFSPPEKCFAKSSAFFDLPAGEVGKAIKQKDTATVYRIPKLSRIRPRRQILAQDWMRKVQRPFRADCSADRSHERDVRAKIRYRFPI
jgi:hypothetical protein